MPALRKIESRRRGRIRQNPVKPLAHRRDHAVFAVEKIKFRPSLADALVVGVVFAALILVKLPAVCLALGKHRVAVFRVAGNARQRHHARVAHGLDPADRPVGGRVRQLPVADALHDGQHGRWRDFRRKIFGLGGHWRDGQNQRGRHARYAGKNFICKHRIIF